MANKEFTTKRTHRKHRPHRKWTLDRKATCHPDQKHYCKGLCKRCYRNTPEFKDKRRNYQRRPDAKAKQRLRKQRANANGEHLKILYGMTLEDYYQLLDAQVGGCAICKRKDSGRERDNNGRLVVDHDHKTGRIRGLLCYKCNSGLGCFKDDTELLAEAINYLQQQNGE